MSVARSDRKHDRPRTRTRKNSGAKSKIFSVKEVKDLSRSISIATQNFLWGRAAGRCEFAGCNRPLWKSSVTSERVNIAQKAHIYSFSEGGHVATTGFRVKT